MNQIQFHEISSIAIKMLEKAFKHQTWFHEIFVSLWISLWNLTYYWWKNIWQYFFFLFCYRGKFIIQKMNEGAFVIVTHGFNNSSYKWRRSIGKKEEIIFYDLIILHSIAFTTEKVVFMNRSEQYWKPKEKKSSQLFLQT